MEYTIVSETGTEAFIKTVNDFIQDGWQPIGGASIAFINISNPNVGALGVEYCQAMTKNQNEQIPIQ